MFDYDVWLSTNPYEDEYEERLRAEAIEEELANLADIDCMCLEDDY